MNQHFVDVDFAAAAAQMPDTESMLGCIPQTEDELMAAADDDGIASFLWWKHGVSLLPRSEWPGAIEKRRYGLRRLILRTYKQPISSCVANGFVGAYEDQAKLRWGHDHYWLMSRESVYSRIGSSSGSGAYLSDGAKAIAKGILPEDVPENIMRFGAAGCAPYDGFNPRRYRSDDWLEVGELFQSDNVFTIHGMDEIASAVLDDDATVCVGRDRHCVRYVDVVQDRGNWYCAYHNSWGNNWGDRVLPGSELGGIGYDSERVVDRLTGYVILGTKQPPRRE